MDAAKVDTCAVLDEAKQRLARGRFERTEDGKTLRFLPASEVTPEQMQRVAYLWPDGEETIAVSNVRPPQEGETRFQMDVG